MQQMVTCPNCGSQNAANQQFCVSCGANLGTSGRPHVPVVTGIAAPVAQPMMTPNLPPAVQSEKQVDIKPTWALAWGLFWRTLCLLLFTGGLMFLLYMVARMVLGYNSVFGSF
ncbi:MAG: zinc ribbon domain-containing protein [Dehalococcoidia bacterium]